MAILTVNAGSSTLKFSVYPIATDAKAPQAQLRVQPCVLSGNIQGLEPGGVPTLDWRHQARSGEHALSASTGDAFGTALTALGELIQSTPGLPRIDAVAHRVVHGGSQFRASVRVTPEVLQQLSGLNSLAPLHQPNNLRGIEAFQRTFPSLPQVACFDTAFHSTIDPVNQSFALPESVTALGVRRYGFHGLSYQFIMGALQQHSPRANARVLMAHLGNGASLCAATGGCSRATTMGFSTLDGLMMGTRSGALDPGVLLFLLEQGWTLNQLQTLLYKQSGLLGVSGLSADMRRLRSDTSTGAEAAIGLFTYRVVQEAGAMIASIRGIDMLAFSGGIGEHDTVLRAQVCERLGWMGVALDAERNQQACGKGVQAIHRPESPVEVWVVPTDEGMVVAQEAARLMQGAAMQAGIP